MLVEQLTLRMLPDFVLAIDRRDRDVALAGSNLGDLDSIATASDHTYRTELV